MTTPAQAIDRHFGRRLLGLRLHRMQHGSTLSQDALAKLVGVSGATISRWESGSREPPLRMIQRVARALGVSAGWLAFGEGVDPLEVEHWAETQRGRWSPTAKAMTTV